jgi:hypothetical protein
LNEKPPPSSLPNPPRNPKFQANPPEISECYF